MNKTLSLLPFAIFCTVAVNHVIADGPDAAATCTACHGANGISVSDGIPNLAGQKSGYLAKQLKNFRSGDRTNPFMNAMAGQLSDEEVTALAEHFSSLPAATETEPGELASILDPSHLEFPTAYEADFIKYTTANRADVKQVRYLFANKTAIDGAAKGGDLPNGAKLVMEVYKAKLDTDGNPIEGSDGNYVNDKFIGYGFMQKEQGWGDKIPDLLRNSDWNYAFFTSDKKHKPGTNQANCLACHQPKMGGDYMFRAEELRSYATSQ